MFNVRAPIDGSADVFLMNTFSDAQIIVSPDVVDLIDRIAAEGAPRTEEERSTLDVLTEHGFLVDSRERPPTPRRFLPFSSPFSERFFSSGIIAFSWAWRFSVKREPQKQLTKHSAF